MTNEIKNITFKKKGHFEFEIFSLQSLFGRNLDHILYKPHRVQFFHVILITKGNGEHVIDFKTYKYQPKTVLFVTANQIQSFKFNKNSDGLVMVFTGEFLYKSESDLKILQSYRIFDYTLETPILTLDKEEYKFFHRMTSELKKEFEFLDKGYFHGEIIRNLLRVILLKAERLMQSKVLSSSLIIYNEFNLFRAQLDLDYSKTRNVKDYAFVLRMNSKKLNHITKYILGKTAKAFIDERVILEIKRLLVHTDLSVQEISDKVGFDEPTNLVKFFKKYTKMTPSTFRNLEKS